MKSAALYNERHKRLCIDKDEAQ